jgi:hypothetical protein
MVTKKPKKALGGKASLSSFSRSPKPLNYESSFETNESQF